MNENPSLAKACLNSLMFNLVSFGAAGPWIIAQTSWKPSSAPKFFDLIQFCIACKASSAVGTFSGSLKKVYYIGSPYFLV